MTARGQNLVADTTRWKSLEQVHVASDDGKIRLTLVLKGEAAPTYSVDDLNDSIVAFLGEPQGTTESVRESIVFTQRAVPGAAPAPAPVAVAVAAAPPVRQAKAPQAPAPLPVVVSDGPEPGTAVKSSTSGSRSRSI
jgi:hypothetical protein